MELHEREIRLLGGGSLEITLRGRSRELDFNTLYQDYYPACDFTAARSLEDTFWIAGQTEQGGIHLYGSLTGDTWTERNTQPAGQRVAAPEHGVVTGIWPGLAPDDLVLTLQKGYGLYLPDCPRCAELFQYSTSPVREIRLEGEELCWVTEAGEKAGAALPGLLHRRVGWMWVRLHQAVVLDLRTEPNPPIPRATALPPERWTQLLSALPKGTWAALIADTREQAESLAEAARGEGWSNLRAMGDEGDALFPEI